MIEYVLGRVVLFLSLYVDITTHLCLQPIDRLEKIIFRLNQVFHTPIWVHRFFFLLWDLEHGVRILDLGVLWKLWVHHFQLLFLELNHDFYTFHSLRFFFYWLIITRKIIGWMLEWGLIIWLRGVISSLTLWRVV